MIVEFPDTALAGSLDKIEVFEVDEFKVHVIGKEDLIVDRLNACVFWKSKDDCRWVKELFLLYYDKIDQKYLKDRCKKEGTLDELYRIKEDVEEILNEVRGSTGRKEGKNVNQMLSETRSQKKTQRSRKGEIIDYT